MDLWAGLDDHELVTLARNGDPEAYGALVRRYQAHVFNTAYRLIGEQQEALDVAQEALVRGYNALDSFDVARPFGSWIGRIATNLALNWLQRRRVKTISLASATGEQCGEEHVLDLPDYDAEPERVYLARERQARLRGAILALPPRYRVVIELRHFQELSYEAIAETLDIPLSDVRSHLFRARQLLRRWLEDGA